MENKFGKLSKLAVKAGFNGEKTVLKDVAFTAPFKIMHPFYEKKDIMTVMILMASAGIMAGDRQEFTFQLDTGARMEVVSQAFEKIHKMDDGNAKRKTDIIVGKKSAFYYHPQPMIPFADSSFENEMNVELKDETSVFVMSEVLTCGRAARGEFFEFRCYKNRVNIRQNGKLIYRDNTYYDPLSWNMQGFGMYEGFSHLGNLIICNESKDDLWVQKARILLDQAIDIEGGITQNGQNLTIVRMLGKTSQNIMDIMDRLKSIE